MSSLCALSLPPFPGQAEFEKWCGAHGGRLLSWLRTLSLNYLGSVRRADDNQTPLIMSAPLGCEPQRFELKDTFLYIANFTDESPTMRRVSLQKS